MALDYKVRAVDIWPGEATPEWKRTRSPFKTIWTKVLTSLEREVKMLGGREVILRLHVSDRDVRQSNQDSPDPESVGPLALRGDNTPIVVEIAAGADKAHTISPTIAHPRKVPRLSPKSRVQVGKGYKLQRHHDCDFCGAPVSNVIKEINLCIRCDAIVEDIAFDNADWSGRKPYTGEPISYTRQTA